MKRLITVCLSLFLCGKGYAQSPIVVDPGLIGITTAGGVMQNNRLDEMKDHQTKIQEFQMLAVSELNFINKWQEKIYKGLSEVSAVIKDARNIVEAKEIVEGIIKYQLLVVEYAEEDPVLLLFAEKSESDFKKRATDLILYISTVALAGGEKMLMDAGERAALIDHVLQELRLIRGLAYSAQRQMYWARMDGVLRALNPFQQYINMDKRMADDMLSFYKF